MVIVQKTDNVFNESKSICKEAAENTVCLLHNNSIFSKRLLLKIEIRNIFANRF